MSRAIGTVGTACGHVPDGKRRRDFSGDDLESVSRDDRGRRACKHWEASSQENWSSSDTHAFPQHAGYIAIHAKRNNVLLARALILSPSNSLIESSTPPPASLQMDRERDEQNGGQLGETSSENRCWVVLVAEDGFEPQARGL
jgi:hypothetical protein